MPANKKLVEIRRKIESLRAAEAMAPVNNQFPCFKFFLSLAFVPAVAPAGSSAALPVMVAGYWGLDFIPGFYHSVFSFNKEPTYMNEWRKMSKVLEMKLPQLQGLVNE